MLETFFAAMFGAACGVIIGTALWQWVTRR